MEFYNLGWVRGYDGGNPQLKWLVFDNGTKRVVHTQFPFSPYFFIRQQDYERFNELLAGTSIKVKVERCGYKSCSGEPVLKVMVQLPHTINILRDMFGGSIQMFEADLPFRRRVMVDFKLNVGNLNKVLFWDIETDSRGSFPDVDKADKQIISMACVDQDENQYWFCDKDEKKMIMDFLKLSEGYQLIVAWNGSRFDFPYLRNRCTGLGIKYDFFKFVELDGLTAMKRTWHRTMRSYRLADLGRDELGIEEEDLEYKGQVQLLWEWFEKDPAKLREYNMADALIEKRLNDKFHFVDITWAELQASYLLPRDVEFHTIVDNILLATAKERSDRVVLPCRKKVDSVTSYTGGDTMFPVAGLHRDVLVLDFKSIYNRIMQSFNIGIDTFDPANGDIRTPNGAYVSTRKSVFAEALENLERLRNEAKAERDKLEPGTEAWYTADRRQYAMKVCLLSVYGVTGYVGSRYYDVRVADDITTLTRYLLKSAMKVVEDNGGKVIYRDTDSVFVMGLVGDLLEVGKKLAGMINKHVEKTVDQVFGVKNCNIEMDVDRVYSKLYFTDAKKRYVGVCVWQGKPCSFVETKGFEVVRKDWPLVSQMVQEELFNMILDERKLEVVRKYLLNVRKQLFEGLLDDRLTVYKSLGKSVDEYDVEPPHVRCAKEMIKQGINVRVGDKIPFLMVGDGVAKPVLPGQKLNLTRTEYKYVWDKYVNSLVERLKLPVVGDNKRLEEFA